MTGDKLGGFIKLIDDVAKDKSSQAEQGGASMGEEVWQPKYSANQDEAGASNAYHYEVL